MKELALTVINNAAYPGQVQLVFGIDRNDKPAQEMANELYAKYAPSLFDPFPVPTIKALTVISIKDWVGLCTNKANAPKILIVEKLDYSLSFFRQKHWDKKMLDEHMKYDNTLNRANA